MKKIFSAIAAWAILATTALAQTYPSPTFKNVTVTGKLGTAASTTGSAGISVPQGAAPSSPANGDIWLTSSGLYYRANGITFGPIGAGTITGPGTTTIGNIAKWGNTSGTTLVDGGPLGTAATQNTGTSGANVPLLNGANTWSAQQVYNASGIAAQIDGAAGSNRILQFSTSSVARWNFLVTGAESGSNTGADLQFQRRSDAGAFIDVPLSIARSTGVVSLSQALPVGSGGTGVTSSTGTGSVVLSNGPTIGLANGSGLPISTGVSGLGAGVATFLGTPTSANLATALTDETGTGAAVFANSPTFSGTPNIAAATATSINKVAVTAPATSATLTIANGTTLTTTSSTSVGQGQYQGTATNDNATAGNIGEYVQSETSSGSAVSVTSNTATNITSISLTAGDWDVWGSVVFVPAGTTVPSLILSCVSTTSGACTQPNGGSYSSLSVSFPAGVNQVLPAGMKRISLASTTTVYIIGASIFTTSTMTAYGGVYARRVR